MSNDVIKLTVNNTESAIWIGECPGCGRSHKIPVSGTTAWDFNGDLKNPTLYQKVMEGLVYHEHTGKSDEICHFSLKGGVLDFCKDCTHDKAGKKAPLNSQK